VDFFFGAEMANEIVRHINSSIANPNAPKLSINIGHSALAPQVMGWAFLLVGVLVLFTKSIGSPKES
jgi:hypothetical protein